MLIRTLICFFTILPLVSLPASGQPKDDSAFGAPVKRPAGTTSEAKPAAQETPVKKIIFELRASDRSLKNAFLRWGEEHRQQVVWRLSGDIPLDASGPLSATSLADAMTQAAAATADKQEPFVIREYDNAIVVLPRWVARP